MSISNSTVCRTVAVALGLSLASPMSADAAAFPLQGRYNLALNGFLLVDPDAEGPADAIAIGTSSIGEFRATRGGSIRRARNTFNIGGCVTVRQAGSGTYISTGPIGTGRVTATADALDVRVGEANACGDLIDLFTSGLFPDTVVFEFDFVVNQKNNNSSQIVDVVGVRFLDESGEAPVVGFETHGVARPVR